MTDEGWTRQKIVKEIISYVLIFLGVFGFKSTFFEPNHIPSGSMLPTMAIGDFILVNKFSYGFKFPFSEWVGDPLYLTEFKSPKRGDIVVFEYPKDRSTLFVKRVVAIPGDEIEVFNNRVFLNGKEVAGLKIEGDDYKTYRSLYDEKGIPLDLDFYKVSSGETKHIVAHNKAQDIHLSIPKIRVPKGHLFMMGDNRDFSSDSRYWGFVPFNHIRGKALLVWFNMVYPWSSELFHIRPWRIGTSFQSLP